MDFDRPRYASRTQAGTWMDLRQARDVAVSAYQRPGSLSTFRLRVILDKMKSLDVNKYATKKTIAQGLLDVALLTANASQLKYVLQVGEKHEFYTLMLSLITISIVLQVAQACLCVILGTYLNINKEGDHPNASKANNLVLCVNIIIMAVNILISSFEMKESQDIVTGTTSKGPS
ncbi:ninjurin-2 isoform X1 [Anoplophora glabripennis]|uniref:ninjurin-2 isoform X1 n=1 Tax=Anoplophora glabripennis TaxID=217634 RepID=UPI0008752FA1|nr:ninjurin-2 isoform X1 [Anoplophora glabripennis]